MSYIKCFFPILLCLFFASEKNYAQINDGDIYSYRARSLMSRFVEADSTDNHDIDSILPIIYNYIDSTDNPIDRAYIYSYLGVYNLVKDSLDISKSYLDSCIAISSRYSELFSKSDFSLYNPVCSSYNTLAILTMNKEMNYRKVIDCYIKAIDSAKEHGNDVSYILIGCNLVTAYWIRENPEGLKYALDIYNKSKTTDDPFLKYCGTFGVAMMYYVAKEYIQAENYLLEAGKYISLDQDVLASNILYANILTGLGRTDEARRYYIKSFENINNKDISISCYIYLSYGNFLLGQGETAEAIRIYKNGINFARKNNNKVFTYQLYKSLSDAYHIEKKWSDAYLCFVKFYEISDSLFSAENEWTVNELLIKYHSSEKDQKIKESELEIVKKNRTTVILLMVILFIVILLVIFFFRYSEKNKMYRKIAKQYSDAIQNEKKLKEYASLLEKRLDEPDDTKKNIYSEKNNDIFQRLENCMKNDRIFKTQALTRDSVAEMLNTNRTYLSRALSDNCGKSFSQYINSYRVHESLKLLSDPKNDMPLKAIAFETGFSSLNTFYKIFRDEVGMTPAMYRNKIMELSEQN